LFPPPQFLSKTIDETVILSHQRNQSAQVMAVDPVYKT